MAKSNIEYGVFGFDKIKNKWLIIPFGCKFSTIEAAKKKLEEYKSKVNVYPYDYKEFENYKIAKHTVIITDWEDVE